MGVEAFYVTLLEAAELVEAWMELYHKQQKRYIELVAESPAEVVIGYENTSTTNLSPRYYGKYVKNHLDEYADILRGAGKAYVTHDCGKLKGLEELMRGSHQNGYIDVAREPTGDFDFSRRLELTGEKVIIGGIDATAFVTLTPEQMKDHVRELLCDVAPGRYFALGSGDAVPIHTPPEVLRAVGEVVAEEGAYPLSADSVSA
jgi:uroporphyrinogen-III decarboxylase